MNKALIVMAIVLLVGCTTSALNGANNTNQNGNLVIAADGTINTTITCSIGTTTVNNTYFPTIEEMHTRMNSLCNDYCEAIAQESNCVDLRVTCRC